MNDRSKMFLAVLLVLPLLLSATLRGDDWPQWRGPLGTGAAPNADPPVEWSETKNIRWKVALPGNGHSTPIVWGDRIFLTTAVPYGGALPPRHSTAKFSPAASPLTGQIAVVSVRRPPK